MWWTGVCRVGIYEFSRKSRLDVFTTSFNVPTRKIPFLLLFLSIASTRGFPIPITSQTFFFFFSFLFSSNVIFLRRLLYNSPSPLIPPINGYFREGGGDLAVFWRYRVEDGGGFPPCSARLKGRALLLVKEQGHLFRLIAQNNVELA